MRPPVTLLAVTLLAACASDTPIPAGPDASPPPDADPSGPVALTDGSYDLAWSCVTGCQFNAPFKAGLDGLDVTGTSLEYTSSCCDVATARGYVGAKLDDGTDCIDAPGLFAGTGSATEPYRFCPALGGPVATIDWTSPLGQVVQYRLQAGPR